MKVFGWLGFGWKTIKQGPCMLTWESVLFGRERKTSATIFLQENKYTKKRRAYFEEIDGDKTDCSVAYAERALMEE